MTHSLHIVIITVIVEDSPCLYERDGSEGYVTNTDIDAALINNTQLHHVSLDCLWRIEVEKDWNVSFKVSCAGLKKTPSN